MIENFLNRRKNSALIIKLRFCTKNSLCEELTNYGMAWSQYFNMNNIYNNIVNICIIVLLYNKYYFFAIFYSWIDYVLINNSLNLFTYSIYLNIKRASNRSLTKKNRKFGQQFCYKLCLLVSLVMFLQGTFLLFLQNIFNHKIQDSKFS